MRRNLISALLLILFLSFGACFGTLPIIAAQNRPMGAIGYGGPLRIPIDGATIFQDHCAACHGTDGHGQGPAAVALKHAVPDLTLISHKNNGRFPYRGVRNVIEGIEPLARAHGSREMPIWGPIFHQVEADQDWGEVRLDAITHHLESMQQK
jgi:mono/diheme cytochrome c family protein